MKRYRQMLSRWLQRPTREYQHVGSYHATCYNFGKRSEVIAVTLAQMEIVK